MSRNKTKKKSSFSSNMFLLVMFIFLTFFLTSCGPGTPREINYFVGTDGMEIDFLDDNSPPDEVYEESGFNVNLFVENKGAFDVVGEYYGILSISFDPFYVSANDFQSSVNIVVNDDNLLFRGIQLPGKSKYYPTGMEAIFTFSNFNTTLVMGQREQPETQIYISLCYPYVTQLGRLVCVDHTVIAENLRQQVCYQDDIVLSDQGAPLAITLVEVENQPVRGQFIRPIFTVHVKNKGSGTVLSPVNNPAEIERVCTFQNLYQEDFNTVDVTAFLSYDKQLICNPNPIKLFNGEGFTRCSVRDEDLTIEHQNYLAPFVVNLSYIYTTAISKDIEIKRINPYGGLTDPTEECPAPYREYQGRCIALCDYCAQYVPNDPACQPSNAYTDIGGGHIRIEFNKSWACQCGADECRKRLKTECLFIGGYCPGSSYCCPRKCRSTEVTIEGVCYPKCPTSCGLTRKKCACGTKDAGFTLVDAYVYCCDDSRTAYNSEEACKQDPICYPPPSAPTTTS